MKKASISICPRLGLAMIVSMLLLANFAAAQIATTAYGAPLTANGSAAALTGPECGSIILLTPPQVYQAGSVFTTNPILSDPKYAFRTFFQFQMSDPNAQASDGMAFVVQTEGANALGADGGYLGYAGITPSVAVEFDTWQNPWDSNDNHVAILLDGVMHDLDSQTPYEVTACQPSTGLFGCMNNGDIWSVWIDYDGTLLRVAIADGSTTRPADLIRYPIDMGSVFGQQPAFIGFSAGTGAGFERHVVLNWLFL